MSTQQDIQNASGACRAALPSYDGNNRYRPLAVANEGTVMAFVSCSMRDTTDDRSAVIGIHLANSTSAFVDVACTMVNGARRK